jgi:hypothetical protein
MPRRPKEPNHRFKAELVSPHQIIVRDKAITVDGATKEVQTFNEVVIRVPLASLSVAVDGAMLFG